MTTTDAGRPDLDPFGPEVRQDPWPAYRHYRDAAGSTGLPDPPARR